MVKHGLYLFKLMFRTTFILSFIYFKLFREEANFVYEGKQVL